MIQVDRHSFLCLIIESIEGPLFSVIIEFNIYLHRWNFQGKIFTSFLDMNSLYWKFAHVSIY